MRKIATLAARCARAVPERARSVVPLAMMAALYGLSSIPGTPRPDDPDVYAVFHWVPPALQNALHVPVFALLAWAWHWSLAARLSAPAALGAAAGIAAAYGVLDEWHQSFVPGRFASLTDVAADAAGAALGAWLAGRVGTTGRHR